MTTIYMVDDDPLFIGFVERAVAGLGYEFEGFETGAELLRALNTRAPDVVILDGLLREGPSTKLIPAITRARDPAPHVVMLTAFFRDVRSYRKLRALGVKKVLQKPISAQLLIAELVSLCGAAPALQKRDSFADELERIKTSYAAQIRALSANELEELIGRVEKSEADAVPDLQVFCHRLASTATTLSRPTIAASAARLEQEVTEASSSQLLLGNLRALYTLLRGNPASGTRDTEASKLPAWCRSVLLVASDAEAARALGDQLSEGGALVHRAAEFAEAATYARRGRLDLVVVHDPESDSESGSLASRLAALQSAPVLGLGRVRRTVDAKLVLLPAADARDTLVWAIAQARWGLLEGATIVALVDSVAEWLGQELLSLGAEVKGATEPADLDASFQRDEVALVLLDTEIPAGSGLELCRSIESDPARAHVPVVFVSARTSANDREAAFQVGADAYLLKPVVHSEVVRTVVRLLRTR